MTDFLEIWYLNIFKNLPRKFKFHQNLKRMLGTSRENEYKFLIISYSFFLRMRNGSDSSCRENQNTHFVLNNFFQNLCHYEVMWKNIVEPDRPQMTI
jgi:hypothetical protein